MAAAKLLLPRYGGAAYVWTGSVMFFQALLLIGCELGRRAARAPGQTRGPGRLQLALLPLPFFFFPLTLPAASLSASPLWGLLRSLTFAVGAPFLLLSTTVVVAQGWTARDSSKRRRGSHSLYAASNAGAAAALIAYPFLIEPLLPVSAQTWLWRALYAAYAALWLSCRPRGRSAEEPAPQCAGPAPSARARALWLMLSAAPCAAMLATTNFLTLDFAAVPLLWCAPLGTYLLTFVLNFKRDPWLPDEGLPRPAVLAAGAGLFAAAALAGKFGLVLFALFALCMIFHKSLAAERPDSDERMGEYYGWIAAGGWLGTALVALAVPLLGRHCGAVALDWAPVAVVALAAVLLRDWKRIASHRAAVLGLGTLALAFVAAVTSAGQRSGTVFSLRSLYGIYTVQDRDGVRWLFDGNTDHGMQFLDPAKQSIPLSYYNLDSPLAEAWRDLGAGWTSIGVVGLGAGSIAAYGRAGQTMDFYELDPDVVAIARTWFTHLRLSAAKVRVVTGDARLSLAAAGPSYDVLILDAFDSGAVPVHLLTKEAFAVYLRRLRPGGVILLHVSNRYLDLRPMLAAAAGDLGLSAAAHRQTRFDPLQEGQVPSTWVAMSRDPARIGTLVRESGWTALDPRVCGATAWTDQHASVLSALAL